MCDYKRLNSRLGTPFRANWTSIRRSSSAHSIEILKHLEWTQRPQQMTEENRVLELQFVVGFALLRMAHPHRERNLHRPTSHNQGSRSRKQQKLGKKTLLSQEDENMERHCRTQQIRTGTGNARRANKQPRTSLRLLEEACHPQSFGF